jgi:hypothetical protein
MTMHVRSWSVAVALSAFSLLFGCGKGSSTNSDGLIPGFTPGAAPAPDKGFQIILDPVTDIEPGGSYEYCTWTDHIVTQAENIKSVQAWQSLTGHHVIGYTTAVHQPPGTTRICTNDDMASFRYSLGAGPDGQVEAAPANLYFPMPAGSQLVINHHYLNAGDQAVAQAQSVINAYFADPATDTIPSGGLAIVDTGMSIPPGNQSLDINCTFQNNFNAWAYIPHMHQLGTTITVTHTHAGVASQLFNLPWDASYQFDPPTKYFQVTAPYTFSTGDLINVHCEWNNTTGQDVTFGQEMCVFFATTVDTQNLGNLACDTGQWTDF